MTIEKLLMTRDDWINRFAARLHARGSSMDELAALAIGERGADATEATGDTDPENWEAPEMVADEHLLADGDIEDDDPAVPTPFSTDEGKWYVANGFGQVKSGPFDSADEALGWISRQ